MVLHISCRGSSYEIGKTHGSTAATQVKGSIAFYENWFRQNSSLKTWTAVQEKAKEFLPYLNQRWPSYLEEIRGIADGASVDFASVLALNVRTEIGYGLLSDGCTAFSWKTDQASFIGQNWDWNRGQSSQIITLHIRQDGKPSIHMITEAGIIGKIGLNSAGVGVTLNALKVKGADTSKLPTHLALRTVLESTSQQAAKRTLQGEGLAAACHITIADFPSGGIGLECTAADIIELHMDNGICSHSNHLLQAHAADDLILTDDSAFRLQRVQHLLKQTGDHPTMTNLTDVLKDEKNYPHAICRSDSDKYPIETLFSVVMDVKQKYAKVKMGRPTQSGEEFELRP